MTGISDIIPQIIINSLIAGSVYSIIVLGYNLIFTTARFFDVGVGGMTVVGGYSVFFLLNHSELGLIPSILIALIFTGLVGYKINKLIYKRLRKQKATSLVMLIASLGVLTVIQAIIAMIFTSQFQSLGYVSTSYEIKGAAITDLQIWTIVLGILLPLVTILFLKFTPFGKAVKAVSDDEEVAKIVGINTEKIIGAIFFLGSAIAALCGIMVGLDTGMEPTIGFGLLLYAIIASIIGGIGNIVGGILGAYFLGFIENFGILYIGSEWKVAIAYTLLILFLLFRPQGILKR
ncbi:MAG TPA: branched-chain amino acid ABC transporter permease [Candidatus Paceibacterota bacterium]|nr:branched-chain amino acid ABC transporter permease [Candidatus Paceibacterota bacterium]